MSRSLWISGALRYRDIDVEADIPQHAIFEHRLKPRHAVYLGVILSPRSLPRVLEAFRG
jgi:hypothetical protein